MDLFLSSFSLFKLGQIQFWLISTSMQQFDVFRKLLENLQGSDCDGNHIQESLSYSKLTQVRASFYQFSAHLFLVASKH